MAADPPHRRAEQHRDDRVGVRVDQRVRRRSSIRDAEQVRRFRERWKLEYPLFVGGLSDKAAASKAFPLLDKVRAYPTTLFVRRDGSVLAVHQGYSGPATGPAHEKLRMEFERSIERLLTEDPK